MLDINLNMNSKDEKPYHNQKIVVCTPSNTIFIGNYHRVAQINAKLEYDMILTTKGGWEEWTEVKAWFDAAEFFVKCSKTS